MKFILNELVSFHVCQTYMKAGRQKWETRKTKYKYNPYHTPIFRAIIGHEALYFSRILHDVSKHTKKYD